MKKSACIYTMAGVLLCFLCTGCKYPPIFAAIEQEVKLKKASVIGFVRGITQIGDDLYVSNGKLLTKRVGDTGTWTSISCPGNAGSLATDGTHLYGVFDGRAYVRNANGWQQVDRSIGIIGGTATVFGQNTDKKIYIIDNNGTTTTEWSGNGYFKGAAGDFCITDSGVYDKNGRLLGNGAPTSGLKAICEGNTSPNTVFIVTNGALYGYNGSVWTSIGHSKYIPQSVTYIKNRNLVLISGMGGYSEIKLDDDDPMNLAKAKPCSVGSSDSSVPPDYYYQYANSVGKWNINPIYAVKQASGYSVLAGAIDSNTKYTGLWGFYNPGQLEWNRE